MATQDDNTALVRITVTGSECTGKTALAEALAEHYRTVWVPEYSRRFVLAKGAPPDVDDVDAIARGQIDLENKMAANASRIIVLDTDLLSTVIYSRHYYGDCPSWIEEALSSRPADLYLLAHIDVPWQPDGLLRDRGDRREEMQQLFVDELVTSRFPFVEVRGPLEERMETAIRAIKEVTGGETVFGHGDGDGHGNGEARPKPGNLG
jgi:NadR type nicotinamide-nucleotide adenylyltransferase